MSANPDLMKIARWYGPADALTDKTLHECHALLIAKSAARGPAMVGISEAIIRRLKSLAGWRSPYRWFLRTNVRGSWVVVSYHHRAQLCWEWSVWFSIGRATRLRSWNPLRWVSRGFGSVTFGVPWIFTITRHRNSSDWMLSGDAEQLILTVAQAHGLNAPMREVSHA